MVVSFKDAFKLVGISIVCGTAVFVSTLFLNFMLDIVGLRPVVPDEQLVLYNAQLAMAKFVASISGGCLTIIAVVMLIFYVRLYVRAHLCQLGVLKALGYSEAAVAVRFAVFGACVFVGAAVGYCASFAAMPSVYDGLTVEGIGEVQIGFHAALPLCLVLLPTAVFSLLAVFCAYAALRRPVGEMLRGREERPRKAGKESGRDRPFLSDMRLSTLKGKKSLAFFMAFAAFCFSAMVQMSLSMRDMAGETMWEMIFVIGLILSVTTLVMAVTSLINGNVKNVALMKAFGYTRRECSRAVLDGYRPFALLGFGVGTVYQYGLLRLMIGVLFDGVDVALDYKFDLPVFFLVLVAFAVAYEGAMWLFSLRLAKIPVKEIMLEL